MVFGETDVGMRRKENEDNFLCSQKSNRCILAVSDGMGGHNAGAVASGVVISAIEDYAKKHDMFENTPKMIKNAISYANEIVFLQACSHKERAGMGATVVMAVTSGRKAVIGNLGDSRAYIVSKDGIIQITEDHSYVNELLKSGLITEEEARNHPKKNEIMKAVGIGNEVFPDIFEAELKTEEALLLCSDGLTNMVTNERICEIVNEYEDEKQAVGRLIEEANCNGGTDNITVVIKKFHGRKKKNKE